MKILIVNIKFLGDLIVSTPALRSLRKKYPDAEIVIIVRKEFEDVLKYNPYINRIILFDAKIKGNKGIENFIKGIKFIKKIREEKFDVFIALHPGDRISFWAWFSKAKIRIAPSKQSFSFLINRKVDVYENTISYLEYYNQIVSTFGVQIDSNKTEFFIPKEDEIWAEQYFQNYELNKKLVVCIHPGASEPSKIWPSENFVNLINLLKAHSEIKILLISGPKDREICSVILNSFNDKSLMFYNSFSILKTAALIKKCALLITHDTGTRHLAVALRVPVLALLPEDNSDCWNFYSSVSNHYSLIGERIYLQNKSFLGNIEMDDVYKKIGEILSLW